MTYLPPSVTDYSPRLTAFRNYLVRILEQLGFDPLTDPDGVISCGVKWDGVGLFVRVDFVLKNVTIEVYEKYSSSKMLDKQHFEDGLALRDMIVSNRAYRDYAQRNDLPVFADIPKGSTAKRPPRPKCQETFSTETPRLDWCFIGIIVGILFSALFYAAVHSIY